uniref:VWFA domain-containing protein n=1 Tax=uncultured bacterium A1Q1_fos_2037 TaxID=1256558 RepID=L7VTH5_9BACT|nr:hypothetical protein [uncultured bacterium A1Q1_fos_2037]
MLCFGLSAAWPAAGQGADRQAGPAAQEPPSFGEVIDIRTGFVRVTLPAGAPPPRVEDIEVLWKRQPQRVVRVVGGADDPLELGIAVDRSASMHAAFEPMRAAALHLVEQAVSDEDRLFAVGFSNETRLLAEGRGEAARVIAALPTSPELGNRPTALFSALNRTLQLFENADARAALIVVSDGCDTAGDLASATTVGRRARDLAIPIFLLMPDRNVCQNTLCQQDAAGKWECKPEASPTLMQGESREMFNPAARPTAMTASSLAGGATEERDRFTGLISANGGGDFVVNDPADWDRAMKKISDLLGRQWTVVFEPSSDGVTSDEIKVYSKAGGHRRRLE